jgi:hypothetical protein
MSATTEFAGSVTVGNVTSVRPSGLAIHVVRLDVRHEPRLTVVAIHGTNRAPAP